MKNITFPVPPNNYGYFAHHTDDGQPLSDAFLSAIITKDGPLGEEYQKMLKKALADYNDDVSPLKKEA